MKKYGIWKFFGMTAWLITSLASIAIGLMVFDFAFFEGAWLAAENAWLIEPVLWIVGLAGIFSLAMFFINLFFCHCCDCDKH